MSWRASAPPIPKKPDPGAALSIAEQLGIPPQDFLYLGDTNTDMKTAVADVIFVGLHFVRGKTHAAEDEVHRVG